MNLHVGLGGIIHVEWKHLPPSVNEEPYIHYNMKYGVYLDITIWAGALVRKITESSLSSHREMPIISLEGRYWATGSPSILMGRGWRRPGCYRPWLGGGTGIKGLVWALLSDGKYLHLLPFFTICPYGEGSFSWVSDSLTDFALSWFTYNLLPTYLALNLFKLMLVLAHLLTHLVTYQTFIKYILY